MADIKISDLTAATTPLGGTEVLPIVQSGVTVKVAVSNLTAGRSVSATAVAITGSTSGTATIVTPAVAGTPTITLPIVTGTLATLAGTETLTNKTLTGAVMNGTVGATTPSTGAFTTGTFSSTLGVTGALTLSGGAGLANATYVSWKNAAGTFTAGSAGASFLKFSDNSFYVDNFEGDTVYRRAASAETMRLASTGFVGIGDSSPTGSILSVYALNKTVPAISARYSSAGFKSGFSVYNTSGYPYISFNSNPVASADTATYDLTGAATKLDMGNGGFIFSGAASGSPAGAITWLERMRIDSGGNVLVTSAAGLGYGTGSGGTVTQATSKATGVTLNKPTGQITMNAAALASTTIVSFVLTNTVVAATDLILINHVSGGTGGAYTINGGCAAGGVTINVRNNTAGSLSEALVLSFAIIKGATA